jgi:hypothetical protein
MKNLLATLACALGTALIAASAFAGNVDKGCTYKGKKLQGKIQFVDAFPDIKIEIVNAFPDIKVKKVDAFPDGCGKWQVVTAFPDIKVQIVKAFPDVKVQWVDAFPGVP